MPFSSLYSVYSNLKFPRALQLPTKEILQKHHECSLCRSAAMQLNMKYRKRRAHMRNFTLKKIPHRFPSRTKCICGSYIRVHKGTCPIAECCITSGCQPLVPVEALNWNIRISTLNIWISQWLSYTVLETVFGTIKVICAPLISEFPNGWDRFDTISFLCILHNIFQLWSLALCTYFKFFKSTKHYGHLQKKRAASEI